MRLAWGDRRAPENATVIHMGVDLPEGVPTTRAGQPERKHFQVLSPASLTRVKGHRYLIAAVAALVKRNVPVRVWLAGEGPLREELERQIREARLCEVVTLLGQLPHQRLLELYAEGQVDAVVLASVDLGDGLHEGIPVSLIEAMAYGVPVVGTMAGGTPELLRDGAGVLVPPGDASVLSDALERLATDTAWRRELGFRGRKRVEEEFAIGQVVDALEDQFRRAVKART